MKAQPPAGKILGDSGLTYREAVEIQERLRLELSSEPPPGPVRRVGGADVAFGAGGVAVAALVVLSWPDMEIVDLGVSRRTVDFPYVPGLLSFREVPVICAAYKRLAARPDVLFCDGQGFAHPRRFGLACHLGVVLDIPTVGCAKSRLVGAAEEPGAARASWTPLMDGDEIIGAVVRTRDNVKPLYISAGHRMNLETARQLVLEAGRGYRVPEPTRRADILVAKAKRFLR